MSEPRTDEEKIAQVAEWLAMSSLDHVKYVGGYPDLVHVVTPTDGIVIAGLDHDGEPDLTIMPRARALRMYVCIAARLAERAQTYPGADAREREWLYGSGVEPDEELHENDERICDIVGDCTE